MAALGSEGSPRQGGASAAVAPGPAATADPWADVGAAALRATIREPSVEPSPPPVIVEPVPPGAEPDPAGARDPATLAPRSAASDPGLVCVVREADGRRTPWRVVDLRPDGLRAIAVAGPPGHEPGADPSDPAARIAALLGPPRREPDGRLLREVVVDGWRFVVEVEPARRALLRQRAHRSAEAASHGGPTEVRAVIPGRVVAVAVVEGDPVAAGGELLVVEAMKMQNEVRSPRDGVVRRVAVGVGESVELGDLLVVVE
jgi:biotin carboxyl carrier protein